MSCTGTPAAQVRNRPSRHRRFLSVESGEGLVVVANVVLVGRSVELLAGVRLLLRVHRHTHRLVVTTVTRFEYEHAYQCDVSEECLRKGVRLRSLDLLDTDHRLLPQLLLPAELQGGLERHEEVLAEG